MECQLSGSVLGDCSRLVTGCGPLSQSPAAGLFSSGHTVGLRQQIQWLFLGTFLTPLAQMEGSPESPHCSANPASLGFPPVSVASVCYLKGSGAGTSPSSFPSPELISFLPKNANHRPISIQLSLPG